MMSSFFFFNDTATTEIYTLSLHDALPIYTRYDVVILDVRMPDMDGLEVLRNIRKDNLADKVIMLTGVAELKVARDSLELGANDFLTKPYDFKKLLACIKRVVKE